MTAAKKQELSLETEQGEHSDALERLRAKRRKMEVDLAWIDPKGKLTQEALAAAGDRVRHFESETG